MTRNGLKGEGAARIILPLGIGTCFCLLGDSTIYTVLPLHTGAAGITMASVGVLMGINRLVRVVSNGVAGHLFDRGPRRRLFLAALLMGGLSTLGYALFRGFWPLFFSRVLWGVAWSGISIGGVNILLSITEPSSRGRWMGLHNLWFVLGGAIGSFLGGLQSDLIGFHGAMGLNAGLSLASVVAVYFLLPEVGERRRRPPAGTSLEGRVNWGGGLYLVSVILLANKLVFSGILAATISLITRDRLSPYFAFIGTSTLVGVLGLARTAVSMTASPLTGRISDTLKDRWVSVVASLAIGAVGLFLLTLRSPLLLIVGLLLCSVPGSSVTVLSRTLVGDLARPHFHGKVMGVVQTVGDMGSAAGPPLAFLLMPLVDMDVLFRLSALLFTFQVLVVLALRKRLAADARRFAA